MSIQIAVPGLPSDQQAVNLGGFFRSRNIIGTRLDKLDEESIIDDMKTVGRKEREFVEREDKILALAQDLVVREGYHGLSMDRIADGIEYSKGTIYNHFPNKEEIIVALGIRSAESRIELFRRARDFAGCARAKMQVIGVASEVFARVFPQHFYLEQIIRISSIWEKTSPERREHYQACELKCMTTVAEIVEAGIAEGNLTLPADFSPQDMVFGLWSLVSGAYTLATSNPNLGNLGINEPYSRVRLLANHLLDGFSWLPLSSEMDYESVVAEAISTTFSREVAALNSRPTQ